MPCILTQNLFRATITNGLGKVTYFLFLSSSLSSEFSRRSEKSTDSLWTPLSLTVRTTAGGEAKGRKRGGRGGKREGRGGGGRGRGERENVIKGRELKSSQDTTNINITIDQPGFFYQPRLPIPAAPPLPSPLCITGALDRRDMFFLVLCLRRWKRCLKLERWRADFLFLSMENRTQQ